MPNESGTHHLTSLVTLQLEATPAAPPCFSKLPDPPVGALMYLRTKNDAQRSFYRINHLASVTRSLLSEGPKFSKI